MGPYGFLVPYPKEKINIGASLTTFTYRVTFFKQSLFTGPETTASFSIVGLGSDYWFNVCDVLMAPFCVPERIPKNAITSD